MRPTFFRPSPALSFRFPLNLFESSSVLPWPPSVNCFVKLYFLVPLTITARCDPRRIFECPAKLFASAFVRQQCSFTRTALNSAAKPAPRFTPLEAGPVLPLPFPLFESQSFSSQFNSVNASSVLSAPPGTQPRSRLPDPRHQKLARFYPCHSLCLNRKAFLLNPIP